VGKIPLGVYRQEAQMAGPTGVPSVLRGDDGQFAIRQGRELPAWRSVLAVVPTPMTSRSGSAR